MVSQVEKPCDHGFFSTVDCHGKHASSFWEYLNVDKCLINTFMACERSKSVLRLSLISSLSS